MRVTVLLTPEEFQRLETVATRERRDPRDQAAVFILEGLSNHSHDHHPESDSQILTVPNESALKAEPATVGETIDGPDGDDKA